MLRAPLLSTVFVMRFTQPKIKPWFAIGIPVVIGRTSGSSNNDFSPRDSNHRIIRKETGAEYIAGSVG